LVRPDQHIAARWRGFEAQAVEQALRVAIGSSMATALKVDALKKEVLL
jgi:hypothetical protein